MFTGFGISTDIRVIQISCSTSTPNSLLIYFWIQATSKFVTRVVSSNVFFLKLMFNPIFFTLYRTIKFSVDIDKTFAELVSLLEKVSIFHTHWHQSTTIKQMIMRYDRFMQLKASSPHNILLVPTLDIEIVWQTHLSRPEMYRADCLRLFNRIIDHSLITDDIGQFLKEQAFIDTCHLYEEQFGEEYCPLPVNEENRQRTPRYEWNSSESKVQCLIPFYTYWDETHFEFRTSVLNDYENPFSFTEFDILSDSNWYDSYKKIMFERWWTISQMNNVYIPKNDINLDPWTMKLLKKSYERFLYIAAKYPSTNGHDFTHPTHAASISSSQMCNLSFRF
jgi:hypothetical protein